MKIVLDVNGADNSPAELARGAVLAVEKDNDIEVIITGRKSDFEDVVQGNSRITVVDCEEIITNDDVPTMAIRKKKNSSLVKGLELLRYEEDVKGFVSAGSTGAVLTGSFMIVRRIKGISRPALAPILPTFTGGQMVLIDCGANVDCKPLNLVHFAIMGSAYAKALLGINNPKVALLNNGVEDKKGNELVKETFIKLKEMDLNFVGNMEARELISGEYDVIVTDGFAGNVALKATEGMAKYMFKMIKDGIMSGGLKAKLGALLLKPTFKGLKNKLDHSDKGGAVFLGVEGIVIKSHGSSKAQSICASILQAKELANANIITDIKTQLDKYKTDND